jgi:peptidoglycan/xylan/chitin deacetylase (PgdA/CDA1 family)
MVKQRIAAGISPRVPLPASLPAVLPVLLLAVAGCPAPAPDGGGPDAERPGVEADERAAERADLARPAVAITVDDLPWVGPLPPGMTRLEATDSILAALAAHDAQATGFVNCDRVQSGAPVLRRWLEAGHRLGNHTSGHLDLNTADPAVWVADARACDVFLRDLTGEENLAFRYPYLHRGHTVERYQAGRDAIAAMGGIVAPITIETLDWIMDAAYVAALRRGDETRARAIADAYLDHVVAASRHYRAVAEERVGRDVAHILLLHANALLARYLHDLLHRLAREGFRFVPLEAALQDPVYRMPDDYLGRDGLSWLYRIPPADPGGIRWDRAEAERLRALTR